MFCVSSFQKTTLSSTILEEAQMKLPREKKKKNSLNRFLRKNVEDGILSSTSWKIFSTLGKIYYKLNFILL